MLTCTLDQLRRAEALVTAFDTTEEMIAENRTALDPATECLRNHLHTFLNYGRFGPNGGYPECREAIHILERRKEADRQAALQTEFSLRASDPFELEDSCDADD